MIKLQSFNHTAEFGIIDERHCILIDGIRRMWITEQQARDVKLLETVFGKWLKDPSISFDDLENKIKKNDDPFKDSARFSIGSLCSWITRRHDR
jgi:hypothetical protein